METEITVHNSREIIFYNDGNGEVKIEVLLKDENLWLTQARLAELFDVQKPAISKHLKNIFEEGELQENSVVSILETTAADGKTYKTNFYNLDAFLQFNEEDILQNKGKVTHEIAKAFAEEEFEKYRLIQDRIYKSDFDLFLERTGNNDE